jgi:hypothetical protein
VPSLDDSERLWPSESVRVPSGRAAQPSCTGGVGGSTLHARDSDMLGCSANCFDSDPRRAALANRDPPTAPGPYLARPLPPWAHTLRAPNSPGPVPRAPHTAPCSLARTLLGLSASARPLNRGWSTSTCQALPAVCMAAHPCRATVCKCVCVCHGVLGAGVEQLRGRRWPGGEGPRGCWGPGVCRRCEACRRLVTVGCG